MFWLIVAPTFNIREKKKERRDFEVDLADRRHDSRLSRLPRRECIVANKALCAHPKTTVKM